MKPIAAVDILVLCSAIRCMKAFYLLNFIPFPFCVFFFPFCFCPLKRDAGYKMRTSDSFLKKRSYCNLKEENHLGSIWHRFVAGYLGMKHGLAGSLIYINQLQTL